MLIVYFYTLKTVNILNLINQIFLNGISTLNLQDIVRINRAISNFLASGNFITFLNQCMFSVRYIIYFLNGTIVRFDNNFTRTFFSGPKLHCTFNFGNNCRIMRTSCFE